MENNTAEINEIDINQGISTTAPIESKSGFFFGSPFADTILHVVLIMLIFYFIIISPSRKKEKEKENMLLGIKNGDEVITSGGIYGRVVDFNKDSISLQILISDTTIIKILKSAVIEIVKKNKSTDSVDVKKKKNK